MKNNKYIRSIAPVILILSLLLALAACSRGADNAAVEFGFNYDGIAFTGRTSMSVGESWGNEPLFALAPMATPPPPAMAAPALDSAANVTWEDVAHREERHIIQSANLDLESEHFDATVTALRQIAPAVDGYIESEFLTAAGRPMFTIVLRVPTAQFSHVLRHIEALADVRSQNQWAEDVTDRFYDMAGSLATRRIEEERILTLITQATDIYELLSLESRLSNVRHAIQSYLSQLNHMAGQIAYSTIVVTLYCSADPPVIAGATLGERIGGAFGDSVDSTVNALQSIVIFFAGAIIPLVLIGLVVFALWLTVKAVRKKLA
jgi:hypothetical protein